MCIELAKQLPDHKKNIRKTNCLGLQNIRVFLFGLMNFTQTPAKR